MMLPNYRIFIANVYRGVYPSFISSLDVVVESILKSIALSMHNQSFENARLLSTLCLNFLPYWDPVERFVRDFNLSSTKKNHVIDSLNDLDSMRRRPIYKLYLRYCQSADEVEKLFGDFEHFDSDIHELLISKSSFDSKTTDILLCCFRGRSIDYLLMFLKLWSDPVIAKADVSTEILYYTRAIFISFFHIPNDVLKKRYLEISKLLAEGLPHHFSSSDGRTLKLAKFLSDFMIFTLKQCGVVGERNDTEGEGLPINPVDDLSRELLCSYQNCCSLSKNFWYSKYHGVDKNQCVEKEQKPIHTKVQSEDSSSDDDDDDDLDPIETLDAPIKCPVVFLHSRFYRKSSRFFKGN
ncbi:unnamed protein product [Lepeophtheirus salmonis]|uniref:(salmon louse) hypothetical protein n=1 Tax=Lepeophtheirus salmonis TaxID=72036 RepID=A0A7R8CE71_LEPSM|nr:unnamed protein product [Lepeophtheirus salmonis]CAF2782646.1 unnamed protein product [Lepeophtheirus salmonis]